MPFSPERFSPERLASGSVRAVQSPSKFGLASSSLGCDARPGLPPGAGGSRHDEAWRKQAGRATAMEYSSYRPDGSYSPGRDSHSDTILYISLVIFYDFNVYA
jgi:hypothetical protein